MARAVPPEVSDYLSRIGKKGGRIGGRKTADQLTPAQRKRKAKKASDAATAAMTPAERSERARKAAQAKWAKKKASEKSVIEEGLKKRTPRT